MRMLSTKPDSTIVLDPGVSRGVTAVVAFHPDGKHIVGGGNDGIRRWRLEDGQELGKQSGMDLNAISMSRDHKWLVCGTGEGASVWDAEIREKLIEVEDGDTVNAVDVSPDSTAFATGINEAVSVWRITSGQRLVGPLKHDFYVTAVRFSPNGQRIATASSGRSIRMFDSRNGDELVTIKTVTPSRWPSTLLAWSNNSLQIFAASTDSKIKLFDVSTGSQLAESQTLDGDDVYSVALAANGKFIATFAGRTISFLDTSTLSQIGPTNVIEDSNGIWAIAISSNSRYLATGRSDGKITIRDLGSVLPDIYGPFHTSNRKERQPDEQPSTSGSSDQPSNSSPEKHGKLSPVESKTHSKDGDDDLLEVEVPSSAPIPEFDFDEPPSPESSAHCEDEVPPLDVSHAVAQSSDGMPVIYPPLTHAEEHLDTVESSQGVSKFKKWLQARTKKVNKDVTSHKPDRVRRKSRRHADHRPASQSPARVDATNEGSSRMAAGQRVQRAVAKPVVKADPKPPTKGARPSHRNKNASRSGQGSANPKERGPAQQANDAFQPSAGGVQLTRKPGKAILRLSIAFPGWMCCGSGTEDEMYSSG